MRHDNACSILVFGIFQHKTVSRRSLIVVAGLCTKRRTPNSPGQGSTHVLHINHGEEEGHHGLSDPLSAYFRIPPKLESHKCALVTLLATLIVKLSIL